MKTVVHKSLTRGLAKQGWLKSYHSFSFASYYNPERMNFGLLRVLNDDDIAAGQGFGAHPHDNMEIVTLPLKGSLKHKDSQGNEGVITPDEVQIMSAGTGIMHSEFNASKTDRVNLLQIWIFPKKRDIQPRYAQKKFDPMGRINQLQTVVAPDEKNGALLINQDAYFSLAKIDAEKQLTYTMNDPKHGLYVFVIDGEALVGEEILEYRDAMGVWDAQDVLVSAKKNSEILFIEVPMV